MVTFPKYSYVFVFTQNLQWLPIVYLAEFRLFELAFFNVLDFAPLCFMLHPSGPSVCTYISCQPSFALLQQFPLLPYLCQT